MPKETGIDLEKVTLNLYRGDKDILASFYSALGWSVAARNIIHKYCEILREKDSQEVMTAVDSLDIELPSVENIKEV